jgi:NAD+--asparagine ADP-ribosyltransferase
MKKMILSMLFILLFCSITAAQKDRKKDPRDKIEALEKIKLLETLDMDEETAVKFFARRNEHQEKMKLMFDELDEKREVIKNKVSSIKDENDPELKKLLDTYFSSQQKLDEEKMRFINSLTDILSYKQIAELTLFERRFREEIRDILFPHRKGKKIDKEQY